MCGVVTFTIYIALYIAITLTVLFRITVVTTGPPSETHGEVKAFSLVYSGNFLVEAELNDMGRLRLNMGIHPMGLHWHLRQGRCVVCSYFCNEKSGVWCDVVCSVVCVLKHWERCVRRSTLSFTLCFFGLIV